MLFHEEHVEDYGVRRKLMIALVVLFIACTAIFVTVMTVLLTQVLGWLGPIALVGGFVLLFLLLFLGTDNNNVAFFDVAFIILAILFAVSIFVISYTMLAALDVEWWQWVIAVTFGVVYTPLCFYVFVFSTGFEGG